jgi:hypothetical protein
MQTGAVIDGGGRVKAELDALEAIAGGEIQIRADPSTLHTICEVTVRSGLVLHVSIPRGYPEALPPSVHLLCDCTTDAQASRLNSDLRAFLESRYCGHEVWRPFPPLTLFLSCFERFSTSFTAGRKRTRNPSPCRRLPRCLALRISP